MIFKEKILLPGEYYSLNFRPIQGINFTHREVAVISCLLHGRSSKKISSLLSISPRTVETHIRNVMFKLECHSRDSIIDFVEKNEHYTQFVHYYTLLNFKLSFGRFLRDAFQSKKRLTGKMVYPKNLSEDENRYSCLIKEHLAISGVNLILKEESCQEKSKQIQEDVNFILFIGSQDISSDKSQEQPNLMASKVIHIIFSEKDNLFCGARDNVFFPGNNGYYEGILTLLERLYGDIDLSALRRNLNEKEVKDEAVEVIKINDQALKKKAYLKPNYKYFCFILFCCLSLLLVCYAYFIERMVFPPLSNLTMIEERRFLPRTTYLAQIDEMLNIKQGIPIVALIGPGGAGKTTLARFYQKRYPYRLSWELNAETNEIIKEALEDLVEALASSPEERKLLSNLKAIKNIKEKEKKFYELLKKCLRSRSPWLLVFDNVEKFSDVKHYLPYDIQEWGKGRVILTTRDHHIHSNRQITHVIQVGELEPSERYDLFLKIMSEEREYAYPLPKEEKIKNFLENLPPFPLDISAAAYYLKVTNVTFDQYLTLVRQRSEGFYDKEYHLLEEVGDYSKTRYSIVVLATQKIMEAHRDFTDLLILLSLINPENIPKELLDAYKNDVVVDSFIYHLNKFSLLNSTATSSISGESLYTLHRNTQEIMLSYLKKALPTQKLPKILQAIVTGLERYFEKISNNDDLERMKALKRHYERLLTHTTLLPDKLQTNLKADLGYIYYNLGQYEQGNLLLEESLEKLTGLGQKDYARLAQVSIYLANSHWDLGNFVQAKKYLQQAVQICRTHLPDNKNCLARALGYLGIIYGELERHDKAKSTLQACLTLYHDHMPENYLGKAQALVHLGIIHRNLGEYEAGKAIIEESLLIYQTHLGTNHIGYAWALTNLGNIYKDMGRYSEALEVYSKSLTIYETYLPDNQVEIARILARIGNVNRDLGYYEKSKKLLNKSLEIYKKYLPEDHVALAWALAHLGKVYTDLEDYEKARDVLEKGIWIYNKTLPSTYVEVGRAKVYYANALASLGQHKEALDLLEQSLLIFEKNYGRAHVECARLCYYLGRVCLKQENFIEAERYLLEALKIMQRDDHSDQYLVLQGLAEMYLKKSYLEEERDLANARKTYELSYAYFEKALQAAKTHFSEGCPQAMRIREKMGEVFKRKN